MARKRRILGIITILSLSISLTGCKISFFGRAEMDSIEFIRAVGVDKSPGKEGNVILTIATQSVQSESRGSMQKKSEIFVAEGSTVFEAVRNFRKYMYKQPFWGHLKYLLIGEEAAKDGLMEYLDFFSRDQEIRLNLNVFIVNGKTAQEVIEKGNGEDIFVFDKLEGTIKNQWGISTSSVVDIIEVMYVLDNRYLSLFVPCIEIGKFSHGRPNNDDSMDIVMGGYALFEGDKLVEYLDDRMSRGLNWLMNRIKSGDIIVDSPDGKHISLEIIDSSTKLEPKIADGKLLITVKIDVTSNISGMETTKNIFNRETIGYLEKQQERVIRRDVEDVIEFAQERNLDIFGAGRAVLHKYPIKWEDEYLKNWKEIFPKIKFYVVVESKINRTYDIIEPSMSGNGAS